MLASLTSSINPDWSSGSDKSLLCDVPARWEQVQKNLGFIFPIISLPLPCSRWLFAGFPLHTVEARLGRANKGRTYSSACPILLGSWLKEHPWSSYRQCPYIRTFRHSVSFALSALPVSAPIHIKLQPRFAEHSLWIKCSVYASTYRDLLVWVTLQASSLGRNASWPFYFSSATAIDRAPLSRYEA